MKKNNFLPLIQAMIVAIGLLAASSLSAQSVANFSLTNVMTNQVVALDQYAERPGVAIVFFSNECPYDNYYKDRLKAMIAEYGSKIQFLLVNPHPGPEESPEKMTIHYADLNVPYLADKEQTLMNALGARKSPEVFLIKNSGGNFSVFYSGAIDDNAQVEKDVTNPFLKTAITLLLNGQPAPASNRAVGCTIRSK